MDAVECAHAVEAEVRELRLIAAHRPAYNRRSKNPRNAWWLVLTDEAVPAALGGPAAGDGALGPFRTQAAASLAADMLAERAGLRTCTQRISLPHRPGKPCVLAELGRCGAPVPASRAWATTPPPCIRSPN